MSHIITEINDFGKWFSLFKKTEEVKEKLRLMLSAAISKNTVIFEIALVKLNEYIWLNKEKIPEFKKTNLILRSELLVEKADVIPVSKWNAILEILEHPKEPIKK